MSRGTEGKGELARSDSLSKPLRHAAARAFLVADQGSGNVPTRKMSLTLWLCFCKIIVVLFFGRFFGLVGSSEASGYLCRLLTGGGLFDREMGNWFGQRSR